MTTLLRKGQKKVDQYLKRYGYVCVDCYEIENGYKAEYSFTHAGVVIKSIEIEYNSNWRCTKVEEF